MTRLRSVAIVFVVALLAGLLGYIAGDRAGRSDLAAQIEESRCLARLRPETSATKARSTVGSGAPAAAPPAGSPPPAAAEPEMSEEKALRLLAGAVSITTHPDGTKTALPELPFSILRTTYARVASGEETDENLIDKLAYHLGALGTPEAIDLLVRMLENEALDAARFSHPFVLGLADHVDDRVARAALARVEQLGGAGEDSSRAALSYVDLLARRGTKESSEIARSYLEAAVAAGSQEIHAAMMLVAHLEGQISADEVLTLLRQASGDDDRPGRVPPGAREAYLALASWRDPSTNDRLERCALESGHTSAYAALAKFVEPARVSELLAPYTTRDPIQEAAVVSAIRGLHETREVDAEQRERACGPILRDVIRNLEHGAWREAVYAIEYDPAFHTGAYASLLREVRERATEESQARLLAEALRALEKSLRKHGG